MRKNAFFVFLTLLILTKNAIAADFKYLNDKNSQMGRDIILLEGAIEYGDNINFSALVSRAKHNPILILKSPGGNADAGLKIGNIVQEYKLDTLAYEDCASACALIWLAGNKKYFAYNANIGFHQAYRGDYDVSGQANALVGGYVAKLGYGENVIKYVTSARPEGMRNLSISDAELLGLEIYPADLAMMGLNPTDKTTFASSNRSQKSYEEIATHFVINGINAQSQHATDAMDWIKNNYGADIYYFNKNKTKEQIIRKKADYFAKWPNRQFEINTNSIKTNCKEKICYVSGVYTWRAINSTHAKSASGTAEFYYSVWMKDKLLIIGERRKRLTRNDNG